MGNVNQKECINVKFSEGLGIFDDHYGYPVIDEGEKYNGPTGKVVDIQGPQAHAGRNSFVPEGKEFSIDIDESPYLHIAIKAEKGTNTCLCLHVYDKAPREHVKRSVVIGMTLEGDAGIYDAIKGCFDIKDDGRWHEYDFDLRKIREKQDDEYPFYPDAGSISTIQFYSSTGSGEHTFHFNDLFSTAEAQMEIDNQEKKQTIEGLIYFDNGLPAAGIEVKLYSHGLMSVGKYLKVGKTNTDGSYCLEYEVSDKIASLEIHTMDGVEGKVIPLSGTMHDLGKEEKAQVNLVAPAAMQPLEAEYQRLSADLTPHVDMMNKLVDVQENAERQDITMLNRATGWDARLIALAVNAANLSADPEVGLSQEVLYGLFRVGLPSDKMLLAQVSEDTVDQALEKMIEAGIVYLDKYLFSWGNVPGIDDTRLKECLMDYFDIEINTATIDKSNDGNSIKANNDTNYLLLTLNDEKTNVNLEIDDVRTAELIVKTENDELNIYLDTKKVVMDQFSTFSINTRLKVHAPGSSSTYEELLEASGLNEDAQYNFASVYLEHRGDAAQLWVKAADKGVEDEEIQTLQLQGKLAFLTKNSVGVPS